MILTKTLERVAKTAPLTPLVNKVRFGFVDCFVPGKEL